MWVIYWSLQVVWSSLVLCTLLSCQNFCHHPTTLCSTPLRTIVITRCFFPPWFQYCLSSHASIGLVSSFSDIIEWVLRVSVWKDSLFYLFCGNVAWHRASKCEWMVNSRHCYCHQYDFIVLECEKKRLVVTSGSKRTYHIERRAIFCKTFKSFSSLSSLNQQSAKFQ